MPTTTPTTGSDAAVRPLAMRLPQDESAPALAREALDEVLDPGWPRFDAGRLCLTEIVTNALRHTDTTGLRLMLIADSGHLFAAVGDSSAALPMSKDTGHDPLPDDGRGTEVLGALADSWGYDRTRWGKWVWFRLHSRSTDPEPAAPHPGRRA
ncbi:ATP-binding protein [Streptomyces sp. NPDC017993]|uniref:ATP-binding protein n=1 Tax=Streptomyces sp. NPDC017993 TaxID=3365027 RepID=UPI003795874B